MKISTVGVIGAGQMGCGIAQVCAAAGYKVLLNDMAPERVTTGLVTIEANLARRVKSGKNHGSGQGRNPHPHFSCP